MGKRANHEGSVYQRSKDGRWVAVLILEDGRRRAFYGATQADALAKKNEAARQLSDGLLITSDRITVAQLFERYLASVKPHVRHKTFRSYEQQAHLHIVPALGPRRIARLSSDELDRFISAQLKAGLSERSVGILHAIIRQALNWGMVQRPPLVRFNVAQTVKAPRVPYREVQPFTPDEARQFVRAVRGHRLGAFFVVTLSCGLREGEALALHWSDVDTEDRELRVRYTLQRVNGDWAFLEPKSHKSRRTIPLPEFAVAALRDHRAKQAEERLRVGELWKDQGLVFTTRTGGPLSARNVLRDFQAVLSRAGMRSGTIHSLRHGCASLLAASGASMKEAQEILGHSSYQLTANLYTHVFEQAKRDAMDRMDAFMALP